MTAVSRVRLTLSRMGIRPCHHHRFEGQSWPYVRVEVGKTLQRCADCLAEYHRRRRCIDGIGLDRLGPPSRLGRRDHCLAEKLDRCLHNADDLCPPLAELLAKSEGG